MQLETAHERSIRILSQLKEKYPKAEAFDLDGSGNHFVSEIEPSKDHLNYDRAVEVIIKSKPHKHLKMTQKYTVISGMLTLHVADQTMHLKAGDTYTVLPNLVHWAESADESWVEIYSEPGWTKEDHIPVEIPS